MKCPFCAFENDKVVDSRESKEGESIRRRRECLKCGKRFTTYERIDEIPYMVVKKDGRRERFDRQKVHNGLMRACEKRPISIGKLEQIVNEAESFVIDSPERERKTKVVKYKVKRGETVASISKKYGTSSKSLLAANGLKSESQVTEGKILKIPVKQREKTTQVASGKKGKSKKSAAAEPAALTGDASESRLH